MTSLYEQFLGHTGRTIHKLDSYFQVYERHFGRFVGKPLTVIEIGCGLGGSLQMWKGYFGPQAKIVGLDVRQECAAFAEDQIEVRIGRQDDEAFLGSVLTEFGMPDIVIDDGSHLWVDQAATFRFLYHRISMSGVYLVEDLHCNYLPNFDGALRRADTFIEAVCKPMIDEINAAWWSERPSLFSTITRSMHLYDSIAVFERGHVSSPKRSRRVPEPAAGEQTRWPRA